MDKLHSLEGCGSPADLNNSEGKKYINYNGSIQLFTLSSPDYS